MVLYKYFFHLTLPNRLPYSLAVVMLFGRSIFSSLLVKNLVLPPLVCELPSPSGYTTQPTDFEVVTLASTLSVENNCNSRRTVTLHVHSFRSYYMRIPLRVIADTNPLGNS